mmetsp:Transcript_17274/g.38244  ORF Transcript_17274/g.38244 Transcript_17274/m.38244 type:complete len:605 (-) Transcript_17274:4-1818(-)
MKSLKLLLVLSMAWAARQAPQCDENAMLQAESPRPRGYRRRPRSSRSFALPLGYTILGPGRQVVARLLLPITVPCPAELRVTMGDRKQLVPVRVRAEPHFGIHGAWFTEGQRFQHLTGTNYAFANPISPFAYEDQVCEAPFVPEFLGEGIVAAFQLQDGSSVKVPMPARQPKRFLVMGDTGLRIKAKNDGWCSEKLRNPKNLYGGKTCPLESLLSNYNASLVDGLFQSNSNRADPALNGWPFEEVCERVWKSSRRGDVMVHVGDYLYSHNECLFPFPDQPPAGEERVFGDCTGVGDDWGDTSAGWIREFFGPARDLLRRLPWIVLRGNHEECARSGHGWFRYLEPRPSESFVGGGDINAPYCVTGSNSYNVEFDHDNWLVVDTSSVAGEEISIDHYTMEEYTKMDAEAAGTAPVLSLDNCDTKPASGDDHIAKFQQLTQLSNSASRQWLASHRPLFGLTFQDHGSGGQLYSFQCQLSDTLAKSAISLPNVAAVVSGHFHGWQLVEFQETRPAQLVVGNSGTQLATPRDGSPNGIFRAHGRPLLGQNISHSPTVGEFGWSLLDVSGETNPKMSAFFLADEDFESTPEIHRTLVRRTLQLNETWAR